MMKIVPTRFLATLLGFGLLAVACTHDPGAPASSTGASALPSGGEGSAGIRSCVTSVSGEISASSDCYGPSFSINDVSTTEGNYGTKLLTFTVTRTGDTGNASVTTFSYTTEVVSDGHDYAALTVAEPATSGSDYQATTGTKSFPANVSSVTISVPIIGDLVVEPNETFTLSLSNLSAGSFTDSSGTGTIENDDSVKVSIAPATMNPEGTGGTKTLKFTVTRTGSTTLPVTFTNSLSGGTATSGAACTAGVDYVTPAVSSGSIAAGGSSGTATIDVTICGDTLNEANETFDVTLGSIMGATLNGTGIGKGTIVDDDTAPSVSINAAGNATNGFPVSFTITLSASPGKDVKVAYRTDDLTAVAGSDYTAVTSPVTVTFLAGTATLSQTFMVNTVDDNDLTNETFRVLIAAAAGLPVNATLGNQVFIGTIKP